MSAVQRFTEGLGFPEGPVRLNDGRFLFVEMTPDTGCVTLVSADGKTKTRIAKTGRPNGLAVDAKGNIWVAETAQRALVRLQLDGSQVQMATEFGGEPFLFLNDVAVGPDGNVYFTDSGVAMDEFAPNGELNPDWANIKYDGRILKYDVRTGKVSCIDRGIRFTNGLAFGPDGKLYINETLSGNIYRYTAGFTGEFTGRELFGNVVENYNPEEVKGPDGMKFGADGCLYVCVFGQGDVTVLAPDGSVSRRIKTEGNLPTNLCFGADGDTKIYVTEVETGSVQMYDVGTDGLPLHK